MPSRPDESNTGFTGGARRYDEHTINQAFIDFLGISAEEMEFLRQFRPLLLRNAQDFVDSFYSYLQKHPIIAGVLERYQQNGGDIAQLTRKQFEHFCAFLEGDISDVTAARLAAIGKVHYRHSIEPAWMMGSYLLYLEHLARLLSDSGEITPADGLRLRKIITRLLFRDMGHMLDGYWNSALEALQQEKRAVAELQEQVTSLLTNLPQLLWSVDVINNRPLYVSPTTHDICELDIEMPIPCLGWTVPEDREIVQRAWEQALAGSQVEVESRVIQPNGDMRWFRRVFHPFRDEGGRTIRIDGLMEDATESRKTVERLHELATTDSLTGLHNRALLHDRLTQAISVAGRDASRQVVLMVMDLDHFKEINDTLGHPVGDQILREVAGRLRAAVRDSDTVARLGGDEFAVLLPDVRDGRKTAEKVAQKLRGCFVRPFLCNEDEFYLGAAIGIAVYPDHGEEVDALMSRADVAMYAAKHKDIGFMFYDAASDPHTPQRLQLSSELRRALDQGEFVLHYQPKIDLKTECIAGVEALLRWDHPELGMLEPDLFIPLAERSGLINPITDWVILHALQQCKAWHDDGLRLSVAVNLSGRTFHQPGLTAKIEGLLKLVGMPPSCLELEITENVLMGDIERGAETLRNLSALGVVISIDDYGTGHSSLAYLKKLPLRTLKIDKSFVLQMSHDDNDAVIVRSTIDMAHNLGYRVVAEGVEDQDALDLLTILGSDEVQGYFLSHPVPASNLGLWLRDSRWAGQLCPDSRLH